MKVRSMALAVLVGVVSLSSIYGADDPFLGVWKLNVDKSRSPAVMQSQVLTLTSEDGMYVMTEDNLTAKGIRYRVVCKLAFDGQDHPMTGSRAGIELISGKRLGPDSVEIKAKRKDGTVVGTYWMTLSADGRMRITLTWLGAEVTGPPARVSIHERQ